MWPFLMTQRCGHQETPVLLMTFWWQNSIETNHYEITTFLSLQLCTRAPSILNLAQQQISSHIHRHHSVFVTRSMPDRRIAVVKVYVMQINMVVTVHSIWAYTFTVTKASLFLTKVSYWQYWSNHCLLHLDSGIGLVSVIHDNTQVPLIDVTGIYLSPGRRYKLGYKKKTTFFLSAPYTRCNVKIRPVMQKLFSNFNGADYRYSTTICSIQCRQSFV